MSCEKLCHKNLTKGYKKLNSHSKRIGIANQMTLKSVKNLKIKIKN